MLKKFNEYFLFEKAKHLTDAGIPTSIITRLFKKNFLFNNKVEAKAIKNKTELANILNSNHSYRTYGKITLLAYSDEKNYVCFTSNYTSGKVLIVIDSQEYIETGLSPTLVLKNIPAKYKMFTILNNNNKQIKSEKIDNIYFFNEIHEKFLLKKLKELKKKIIKETDIGNYRTYTDKNIDVRYRLSAISTLNSLIEIINNEKRYSIKKLYSYQERKVNGGQYVFYKLLIHFDDLINFELLPDNIKKNIDDLLVRYTGYWNYEDFADLSQKRIIKTKKDKRNEIAGNFNI